MEEFGCPRCKTTKYTNPSLRLLVNVCGHALCEGCVDVLYVKGSGVCIECGVPLRKTNFRLQIFEDSYVEKEVDVRKRILRDFNKREEDFATLREYNDYLELIETIVFNITNSVDVDETRKQIEQYKKDNKDVISKNRSKQNRDDEYQQMVLEREKQENEMRRNIALEQEMQERERKKKKKKSLIDDLTFSDMPAQSILASHVELEKEAEKKIVIQQPTLFSTGIRIGHQEEFAAIPEEDVILYTYEDIVLDFHGPNPPAQIQLDEFGYMSHVRSATDAEKAAGFEATIACARALHDAFGGLFDFPVGHTDC